MEEAAAGSWPTAGGPCAEGGVIEGLYAAGNCTASFCGPYYVGAGQSIGASSLFGYIAAKEVAAL